MRIGQIWPVFPPSQNLGIIRHGEQNQPTEKRR